MLIGLYASRDLLGLTFSVFDKHCDTVNGTTSTIDSCIDPNGYPYQSRNTHYVLLMFGPALLLIIWRLAYFAYYTRYVQRNGTISAGSGSIDMELQARVAAVTGWRLVKHGETVEQGYDISYNTLLNDDVATGSDLRTRLLIIGRFLFPLVTIFVAILLAVLKLSQYALWNGFPWWALSVMVASAIGISLFAELAPVLISAIAAKRGKTPPS